MGSKSLLMILAIGICGLGALGFLTKFALDSNPSLVRLSKLKIALAEDFSSQGAREVSVRALPRQRGFEIRIEAAKERLPNPAVFAGLVAESFLRKYTGPSLPSLKLTLLEPAGFGCRGPETYFEKEFSVPQLTLEMELRSALQRMEAAVAGQRGFRVLSTENREPLWIKLEVPPPKDEEELNRSLEFLRAKAREHLSAGAGRVVDIEVWAGGPAPRLLKEERIERTPINRRRLPVAPPRPKKEAGG